MRFRRSFRILNGKNCWRRRWSRLSIKVNRLRKSSLSTTEAGGRPSRSAAASAPGAVRNRGVEAAVSRWIAFADSDDLWLPEKLKTQRLRLESGNAAALCHTREIWLRNGATVSQKKQKHRREGDLFHDSLKKCIIGPSTVLLSRPVFEELGGFDETLEIAEDYEFWLRWTDRFPVVYCGEPLVVKRAGDWPQLSARYGQIEIFRLQALLLLLRKRTLSEEHRFQAAEEAARKAEVYALGCRKRGRTDEALEWERIAGNLKEKKDGLCFFAFCCFRLNWCVRRKWSGSAFTPIRNR